MLIAEHIEREPNSGLQLSNVIFMEIIMDRVVSS
jgi:hypothetical protein